MVPTIVGAYVGSTCGTLTSRVISCEVFAPVVLVAVTATVWRRKQVGMEHAPRSTGFAQLWRCVLIGVGVGFYDGVLGPGAGSFFVIGIVTFLGHGFPYAPVKAKIANLVTNTASLMVYGTHGGTAGRDGIGDGRHESHWRLG